MNRKQKLEARKAKLEKRKNDLMERMNKSNDVDEVRSIGDRLRDIVEDIKDIERDLLDIAEEEGKGGNGDGGNDGGNGDGEKGNEGGNGDGGNGENRSFNPLGTYGVGRMNQRDNTEGMRFSSMEQRKAFRDLVVSNVPIPAELRDNANTLTSDVASVIPEVIVNRIVEGLTVCGMILPLVTRTAFAAGVVVPTSSVKPVATWVSEGATSDRQKKTTGEVTFTHYKLRCEVSMSAEVGAMAISAFEDAFVANVVDAMTVAIEKAIIGGTGTGQPSGILKQSIPSGQTVEIADATNGIPTYEELVAAEAALPVEYENTAKWFMTKKQFMNFVSMTDDNGQPIARVNYGVEGKPERYLLGREVVVHPYATEMGDYTAAIYDFKDYVLNTIFDMGVQKKQDWDTEDLLTKAVMALDGKPVSNASLVVMKLAS